MKKHYMFSVYGLMLLCLVAGVISCGKENYLDKKATPLIGKTVKLDPDTIGGGDGSVTDPGQTIDPKPKGGMSAIFNGSLGVPIAQKSISAMANDATGLNATNDRDGDGLSNDEEEAGFTNPDVSDYPRITTRIGVPITMKLEVSETDETQNHTELVGEEDTKNTIDNCMEAKQYNQINKKTTPYVVKNSNSFSYKNAGSSGYSMGMNTSVAVGVEAMSVGVNTSMAFGYNQSSNQSWDNEMSGSTMSEKTVFSDINYVDNLNRNGVEFKSDTVDRISRNYRQSNVSKNDYVIKPDAGVVRAAFYIKNESMNQPVRIHNVECTLSFRTPSGKCLPVESFQLRNSDYTEFDEEIGGGEELGPFTIERKNLNTYEVKQALANGYVPQVHVVNYDMNLVEDTIYNPGVSNLKMVEETVKGRTALIKITANGVRDIFRVPAYDVDENGVISPGISLKKALFKIYRSRLANGEAWESDEQGRALTVPATGLWWKQGFIPDPGDATGKKYNYTITNNTTGNTWSLFSTYIKKSIVYERDSTGKVVEKEKRIETIDKIGNIKKYNPFDSTDNLNYNPDEPLEREEMLKMKYWMVLHNGRYYNGDLNDPIWAGERYEIVLFNADDFNEQLEMIYYSPLQNTSGQDADGTTSAGGSSTGSSMTSYSAMQSYADFYLNTLWNRERTDGNLARAVRLGKIVRGDTIKLEVELDEFRSLFDVNRPGKEFDPSLTVQNVPGRIWHKFNYTFDKGESLATGKPGNFTFEAWGGCNQIGLYIQESANARHYTAAIWKEGQSEDDAQIVKIENSAIKENGGFVSINRFSKDMQGNDIGILEPADGQTSVNYRVRVRAHGVTNGVQDSTLNNASTTGILVATVTNPTGTNMPAFFDAAVYPSLNRITVNINQADNAEFYAIEVYGPYNYGYGNGEVANAIIPKQTVFGHPGVNIIDIPDLDASSFGGVVPLTDEEKNFQVAGMYRVKVLAMNKYIMNNDGTPTGVDPTNANGDTPLVAVNYDPYGNQRVYSPAAQIEQFNPKDVDLEVNFNEGSGWFRLKLAHDDIAEEDRAIDCRYTTNFNQRKGRVTIYFTAPTGADGPQNKAYNVFRGGAEDVEVYLRTVAKPEYRDSLWLKPNANNEFNPAGSRCFDINELVNNMTGYDPLKYWIQNEHTDVTNIENFVSGGDRIYGALGVLNVPSGDFGVIARSGKSDFFFSPMKKLTYKVSASLAGDVDVGRLMTETTHVDNPENRAMGGEQSIKISNIDTEYATNYRFYLRKGRPASSSENLNVYPWFTKDTGVLISADQHEYLFSLYPLTSGGTAVALQQNTEYTICMVANNDTSTSSRVYTYVKTMPQVQTTLLGNAIDDNGAGFFMDPAVPLTNSTGNIFLQGTNFAYGEPLLGGTYNLYDTGNSGNMVAGRFFRIVNNGVNVASASGLNLAPVAKNLTDTAVSPPSNQVYIDPLAGKYMLPRPVFWSRCEDNQSITDPEISVPGHTPSYSSYRGSFRASEIFNGNCAYSVGTYGLNHLNTIYPFGQEAYFLDKGTTSFWYKYGVQNGGTVHTYIYFSGDTNYIGLTPNQANININGTNVTTQSMTTVNGAWTHCYVVWDRNAGLSGGRTIRVFVNGAEVANTTAAIPPDGIFYIKGYGYNIYFATTFSIDNVKVWNQVVSEDPSWEYNGGAGRENALHPIYGAANGYRPVLTAPGGVGFYCLPE